MNSYRLFLRPFTGIGLAGCLFLVTPAARLQADEEPGCFAEFDREITRALSQPDLHEYVRHHFESTRALCRQAWTETENNPEESQKTVEYIGHIIEGLRFDAARPEVYLSEGKRSLIIGYTNRLDGSLQFYACQLPPAWDPGRAYPLIVSLHGRGPSHPLSYVHIHFGTPPGYGGRTSDETDHILIAPWAHGNAGYTHALAEEDVMQSLEDVRRRFNIDDQRQYLQGHSMGGFGSWYLGAKYADRWAAVLIVAGGYKEGQAPLAEKLAALPVRLWTGAEDPAVPPNNVYRMQGALEAFGGRPDVAVVPGWDHRVPEAAEKDKNLRWLLQHRR